MREAGAIGRPDGIDGTFVGFQIKELTGQLFVYRILIAVLHKPFFVKLPRRLAKMSGYSSDIGLAESGCHFLAAIGTSQAIDLFPYFFLHGRRHKIDAARGAFLGSVQEFPEGGPAFP